MSLLTTDARTKRNRVPCFISTIGLHKHFFLKMNVMVLKHAKRLLVLEDPSKGRRVYKGESGTGQLHVRLHHSFVFLFETAPHVLFLQ